MNKYCAYQQKKLHRKNKKIFYSFFSKFKYFIAVCKKLVKTQIKTILAHKHVKAISQEPLAQSS